MWNYYYFIAMLHRFFNPSCKTYVGTSSVTDIIIRDHGVYHDSGGVFHDFRPLFQPKVAKMVAKASGWLQKQAVFSTFSTHVWWIACFFNSRVIIEGFLSRAQITMKNNYYILAAATPSTIVDNELRRVYHNNGSLYNIRQRHILQLP